MAERKSRKDPFRIKPRSPLVEAAASPVTLGATAALALVVSHKLGRSPIALESLPRSVARLPPSVVLVSLGLSAGYIAGKSAEWLRWKVVQKLLAYQGWVDSPRSTKTKMWAMLMKVFTGAPDSTYTYQRYLPNQPLPELDHTLDLWLQTASNIVDEGEFEQTKEAIERFRHNEGPQIQTYLKQRYLKTVNWLSEYWLTAAYLSSRESLAISSNYFLVNKRPDGRTTDQLARAAACVHCILEFNECIVRGTLAPVTLQDMVPLCMNGYRHIFNSLRVPEENIDRLMRHPGETHIVVIRKGHYYRMETYINDGKQRRMLRPEELKLQLKRITQHADNRQDEPLPVAALTTLNRTEWAKLRLELMDKNPETLNAIESSMFVFTLDDKSPKDMHEHTAVSATGRGYDRWFDKGFNVVVWPTTAFGCNVEHSGIDAMVFTSLTEYLMLNEKFVNGDIVYTAQGPSPNLPEPTMLTWNVDHMKEAITTAYTGYMQVAEKIDVHILNTQYGKGFMKKCKLSPDGFIQMAIQLAYFKLHKETPKTYEPSTGRLYALGRTENIHPASTQSKAWVRSMTDKTCTNQSRQDLLRRAVNNQTRARLTATVGQGCDRHLLGLYCASRELQMDIPALFMDKAWRAPFKLSTSQTPTRTHELKADMDYKWIIGGFGPACSDGYGMSYVVLGDDLINIVITSWKHCESTGSAKMAAAVTEAMDDMKALFA